MAQIQKLIGSTLAFAKPRLQTFSKYAAVELTPPSPMELKSIGSEVGRLLGMAKRGEWKNITVREAWLNMLVAVEVTCWFYVGECIGKRHLVGYKV